MVEEEHIGEVSNVDEDAPENEKDQRLVDDDDSSDDDDLLPVAVVRANWDDND